jgi:DNA-binding transcriptional LysR family regulator
MAGVVEDKLRCVTPFIFAVEAGSFALAATRLGKTRSSVGKSIAQLEKRLGTRLFNRTTRQLSLTENGEAYYERCKRALAEIDAAEEALDIRARQAVGRLRVSAPMLLGQLLVAPVLARLVDQHPQLDIEVSFSDRVVDLVEERIDLAVRTGELRDSTSLAARRIGTIDFVLCAAPAYLDKHGVPRSHAEFAQHACIVYATNGPPVSWEARDTRGVALALPIRRRLGFDDMQAIANAALAGAGIARLPRWLVMPHVHDGSLRILWDRQHAHQSAVHLVWPQTRYLPAKTRVAIDALVGALPPLLGAAGKKRGNAPSR